MQVYGLPNPGPVTWLKQEDSGSIQEHGVAPSVPTEDPWHGFPDNKGQLGV